MKRFNIPDELKRFDPGVPGEEDEVPAEAPGTSEEPAEGIVDSEGVE